MRILHYPPIDDAAHPNAMRSAPHEDIGVMTVIPRATEAGLQVLKRSGEWLDVNVPEGAAIINAGDALQYITGIPSTTHRVINSPAHRHRYSIPFFGNFPAAFTLNVMQTGSGKGNVSPITYGEFLNERYKKIGIRGEG